MEEKMEEKIAIQHIRSKSKQRVILQTIFDSLAKVH